MWTCSGDIDTRDAASEAWACAPDDPLDPYPYWACNGNVDKSDAVAETWSCDCSTDLCQGNVNKDDDLDEVWGYAPGGVFPDGYYGIGHIDADDELDSWDCHVVNGNQLYCPWDYGYSGNSWMCEFTSGSWECWGETGRFAPIVGPIPMFHFYFVE